MTKNSCFPKNLPELRDPLLGHDPQFGKRLASRYSMQRLFH